MQLKIYLSSSYFDLVQYREKVYRELRSLRHDVIAMEDSSQRMCDRSKSACKMYVTVMSTSEYLLGVTDMFLWRTI